MMSTQTATATTRPILFSTLMVRALLAGTKTQTRRIVKPPRSEPKLELGRIASQDAETRRLYCPYGQAGDCLWVREQFARFDRVGEMESGFGYAADLDECGQVPVKGIFRTWDKVRHWPSIHMPRAASRIMLEITEIRVERLQDISEEDSLAEGVSQDDLSGDFYAPGFEGLGKHAPSPQGTARSAYALLWEEINGPTSWDANPWVWALTFKRVTA